MSGAAGLAAALTAPFLPVDLFGIVEGLARLPALLLLPAVWVAWAACRHVPWWTVAPGTAVLLWSSAGAMPLLLHASTNTTRGVVGAATALAGLGVLAALTARRGEPRLRTEDGPPPAFSVLHLLAVAFAGLVVTPALLTAWLLWSLDQGLRWGSGEFVALGWDGLDVAERTYRRGDDEVRLIAMVHIGDPEVYAELDASIPDGAVVLAEGVTDREHRVGTATSYAGIAANLGLVAQPYELGAGRAEIVNADVDLDSFQPVTLRLLELVLSIWDASDAEQGATRFARYISVTSKDPEVWLEAFWQDVVERRNAHVLGVMDAHLDAHPDTPDRVILPWGGLHMRGLSAGLEARGFEVVGTTWRTLVPWRRKG
ncbi:MAG: hypothetical protein H6732_06620 [Alphaproteobacteria bacterium]|nr:hypothetical protein [Alphaproteobacteria bacterium]